MENAKLTNQDKKAQTVIFIISLLVFAFLIWLIYFKPVPEARYSWVAYLPFVNAIFNTITAMLLIFGYKAIKAGDKKLHKSFMMGAAFSSALFLISYITYHHFQGDTKFLAQGTVRYVYFFILITHVLLSIVQVPLIFLTFYHAFKANWSWHKKLAKVTFPIWLYVSVTGVLVFIFLRMFN